MAQCRYCDGYVPDGVIQCPHCQASLQATAIRRGEVISPFELRAQALLKAQRRSAKRAVGQVPARRLALLGCLGVVILMAAAVGVFYVAAPDLAQVLIYGTPTSPPPTRLPTPTPSPTPSPTPEWTRYEASSGNFAVAFPPIWVVVDYSDPNWEKILLHKAHWYSWLTRELSQEKRLVESEYGGIRAFDIRRLGYSSTYCRLDPYLARMSNDWIKSRVSARLLAQGHEEVHGYDVRVAGRDGVLFDYITRPKDGTPGDQPIKTKLYLLADDGKGYWCEISGLEDDMIQDTDIVQAIVKSLEILTPPEVARD